MLADLNDVPKVNNNNNTTPAVLPSSGVALGRVISVTMPQGTGVTGTGTRTVLSAKPGQGTTTSSASAANKTIIVMPISHGFTNTRIDSQPVAKKIKMG